MPLVAFLVGSRQVILTLFGGAEQQISKGQTDAWMAAAGLKPVEDIALFDDKWFAIYAKSPRN